MKAKEIVLGSTGIKTVQNAFGALPVQRENMEEACKILQRAYEGGMTFFDTARLYSDSEEKMGNALSDVRKNIFIATKTMAKNPDDLKKQIETSLNLLKTDYVDIYQFHCADQVYAPGDGTGMYECMEDLKRQGMIRHIGITAHKVGVAEEAVKSGLYETLQFPFSYLSSDREINLVKLCEENNVGFIAMKALAGGLIRNSRAAFAFTSQFKNVLPIWGIQRMSELEEFLSYMEEAPEMTAEIKALIDADKKELDLDFCRGCGYCMPCPKGIIINNCARMSLMVRRAPTAAWTNEHWQAEMKKIETCIECGACKSKCPYELDTPNLLKKNYEDYKQILAGKIKV
ncbi:MAG: aldo/keto reductase [Treponema sp.]|nr:aldo/keto reductase [Treponema sp.]